MSSRLNNSFLLILFVFVANCSFCSDLKVLYGKAEKYGSIGYLTGEYDSFFARSENGTELRMKHSTNLKTEESLYGIFLLEGSVGVKTASNSITLDTEIVKVKLSANSIVVMKRTDNFDRICVVKGNAFVTHKKSKNRKEISADCEIAASEHYLSKIYKRSDDLRFMWYWSSPEKEPSLLK